MVENTPPPEPNAPPSFAVNERWGDLSSVGFTAIPNTLIQAQAKLGISPTELTVLLNLIMHWWDPLAMPFPRTDTIETRSGLSRRTVQRSMKDLERRGFIRRIRSGSKTYISLDELREKLEAVAPDYAWRRERQKRTESGGRGSVRLPLKAEG